MNVCGYEERSQDLFSYQLLDYGNRIYFKTIFVPLLKLIF